MSKVKPGSKVTFILGLGLIVMIGVLYTLTGSLGPDQDPWKRNITSTVTPDNPENEYVHVVFGLTQLGCDGKSIHTLAPLSGANADLAEEVITNYMIRSAGWPAVDVNTLDECYLLRATYADGKSTDYYAFLIDGKAVMQGGLSGHYSRIDDGLYERLIKLMQNSSSSVSGVSVPDNHQEIIDRTNLDACVTSAILTNNHNRYRKGDFSTEAHTVLKIVEKGSITTVHAMALYLEIGYAGSGFFDAGGSHMPVAITFEKQSTGEYELKEYWTPHDGAGYAPSIQEKFPSDIYKDALDTQKYIVAHMQTCYAQAIEYGNVPVTGHLAKLINIICSSPAEASNPRVYIDTHRIEYRDLIYYGNYTLRYCYTLFERGGQTGLEGQIMASACRDILGKEGVAVLGNTGQDWYDAFKQAAKDVRRQKGDEYMQKNLPGSWLLLQMLEAA
jgi:hypothetical protein